MRSSFAVALVWGLAACGPAPSSTRAPEPQPQPAAEASGTAARWSYEIRIDEALEHMQLGLCVEGQLPERLTTGGHALAFVDSARVRGGPELERDRHGLRITTLGEHGCVDLEIDLGDAADASGRDAERRGDTLMLAPDRWLWYPAPVPDQLEAKARFALPDGMAATVPWPLIDTDDPAGWRSLDRTTFGWNAWVAFGRHEPLRFVAAECEFEVAILDSERQATDAGVEAWLRAAAEASAALYGRFPRERVSVVVIPSPGWGSSPVMFGMARRGGGGSIMLLLNQGALDGSLPGEWVAVHELLHLGLPLVADPWMAEGFVTYYTQVLRARVDLYPDYAVLPFIESEREGQARAALESLFDGFADRPSARTLASASASMRQTGAYRRVYWGGAAVAYDLDVSLRNASHNQRSLDDLMLALAALAPEYRRVDAADLLARMDEQVARWYADGELDHEVTPSAIAARHLRATAIPKEIQRLRGIAVSTEYGRVRLLADPIDEARVRYEMFGPKTAATGDAE